MSSLLVEAVGDASLRLFQASGGEGRMSGLSPSSRKRAPLAGRNAVSEDAREEKRRDVDPEEDADVDAHLGASASDADDDESDDSEPDVEAHGSWGGIG